MTQLAKLDGLIAGLESLIQQALDDAAEEAVRRAQALAPRGEAGSGSSPTNVPGALAQSIHASVSGRYSREVGTDRFYAWWVENGRKAFVMKGKLLRFYIGGNVIFCRSVGPAKPQPFISPVQAPMQAWLDDRVNIALSRFAG